MLTGSGRGFSQLSLLSTALATEWYDPLVWIEDLNLILGDIRCRGRIVVVNDCSSLDHIHIREVRLAIRIRVTAGDDD